MIKRPDKFKAAKKRPAKKTGAKKTAAKKNATAATQIPAQLSDWRDRGPVTKETWISGVTGDDEDSAEPFELPVTEELEVRISGGMPDDELVQSLMQPSLPWGGDVLLPPLTKEEMKEIGIFFAPKMSPQRLPERPDSGSPPQIEEPVDDIEKLVDDIEGLESRIRAAQNRLGKAEASKDPKTQDMEERLKSRRRKLVRLYDASKRHRRLMQHGAENSDRNVAWSRLKSADFLRVILGE